MIGRQVSHFYIIRTLGSGGMGVVYEAQDTRLPRSVAIKFLKPSLLDRPDALKRFKREARLASSLNHPNICTVLEVDEVEGQSFIVMELLRGASLKSRLQTGRLTLGEVADIGMQVAGALAAAHDQGIIHRDITPTNVYLTEGGVVKVLDFGLAKHFRSSDVAAESTDDLTSAGAVAGTIHYMAPERLEDDGAVDYRCDLFSLGAMLYQMATGALPFDMAPRSALIAMIQHQSHVPLRLLAPEQPVALERIISTLLAKSPDDRFQSARDVRNALAALVVQNPGPGNSAVERITPRPGNSVAVLRFEVIGRADEAIETFRDGLAEDISAQLSAIEGLTVTPRTHTRHVVGSMREIGAALGTRYIIEGSIQRLNAEVRIIANLIETTRARLQLPTLSVDRPFADSLSAQAEIARVISAGLSPALLSAARHHDAPEPEAHNAYQRGLHHWRDCFSGGWRLGIEHFEYAIARDPRFALAHVALANAYNFVGFYSLMKPGPAFAVAATAARRALAIDDSLAAAHRELALAKFGGEWDWEGSEEEFRRALALNPGDALTHVQYSWLLILLGRGDAAYAEAQKAHGLAPSSRLVATARAQTLYIGGMYDDAAAICDRTLDVDPDYVFANQLRGLCHLALASRAEAIADLERAAMLSLRAPYYLGLLGRCYGQFGTRSLALALVDELERRAHEVYVPPQCYVFIYAGLGEHERALAYQDAAYADGASPFNYLTPAIRGLYALDPYHKGRLQQMRLTL